VRVAFTIPGPPEGKRRPRVDTRGGHAHVHPAQADIDRERIIRRVAREAMAGLPPFAGPTRVDIEAVFEPAPSWPKRKTADALAGYWHTAKPDKDNVEKSILDGLNPEPKAKREEDRLPFCLTDDAQVCDGRTIKRYGSPARVEVVIESLSPPDALL
jgi:Holliday junction resolvase RusA-like endonuclease